MSEDDSFIGQQIDNFRVEEKIGQGGMSAVYRARDVALERTVVLKVMLPSLAQNEELRLRFQREARATAQLYHPNIVPIYFTGSTPEGRPYIALRHIKGGSLSERLHALSQQGQWISAIYALSVVRQIADALTVAHEAGIIHRDLKPSNILLRRDGTPVLSDLGIAAVQQATMRLTQTGSIIGTPNYMSPEQASSQIIDGRSDIYSLGVILYELLSGRLPFDADSPWAMIHQHIYEEPAPLRQIRPDLTPQTYRVVETCLQKRPDNRYPDAAALVAALDEALAAEDGNPRVSMGDWQPTHVPKAWTPVPQLGQPPTVWQRLKNRWRLLAALVGLLSLVAAIVWVWPSFVFPDNEEQPAPEAAALPPVTSTQTPIPTETAVPPTATFRPVPTFTEAPAATGSAVEEDILAETAAMNFPKGLLAFSCASAGINTIYLSSPDGRLQTALPGQPTNSVVPAFSPDGTQISYRSNSDGSWQIYASNLDGSNFRQVTGGSENNYEAVWSPDSSRFVFVSDRSGNKQIFVMNGDGTNQQPLTLNDAYNDDPSWSVNNQIVYESNQDGRFSLYLLPPEGGEPQTLISLGDSSTTPAWSPDGNWVAFESRQGDTRHIWLATNEGTSFQQITVEGVDNQRPAWSPDGRRLAFHSNYQQPDDSFYDIWIIDIEDRALQRITTEGDCFDPAWSRPNAAITADLFDDGQRDEETTAVWPVSDTGVEACRLLPNMIVTATENARLWPEPDVTAGFVSAHVDVGVSLRVLDGPVWGRILRDEDESGWWWHLETVSGGDSGWLWQNRLQECTE